MKNNNITPAYFWIPSGERQAKNCAKLLHSYRMRQNVRWLLPLCNFEFTSIVRGRKSLSQYINFSVRTKIGLQFLSAKTYFLQKLITY